MTVKTHFILTPDELKTTIGDAIAPLVERINQLEVSSGSHKYAYTVAEVGELIGYSKRTVLEFINRGRKNSKGKVVKLRHREITTGEYRILPADLEEFLACF